MTSPIAAALLDHYDRHARALPWRTPPGIAILPDPYRVWLSEIMLQQTTVAAVVPYFLKFTGRWPTVNALAAADDADVMAAWAGLGYYARARNLLACARKIANERDGVFPDNEADLLSLPGVGAYTAAAIAAIAFGQRAVVVDANVERVVSRLFALEEALPQARPTVRERTDHITPWERAGDFAQAMMDLGASICSVRQPKCMLCPLAAYCTAKATGAPETYPRRAPKQDKPHRAGQVWWLERGDGHVWLERRGDRRMLGGMRGLPSSKWDKREGTAGVAPVEGQWITLNKSVEHAFTHFTLSLTILRLEVGSDCQPPGDGEWWPLDRLPDAGLPSVFAKTARLFGAVTKQETEK